MDSRNTPSIPKYYFGPNNMQNVLYVKFSNDIYIPRRILGQGTFCTAKLFANQKDKPIVIKSEWTKSQSKLEDREIEIMFMKELYPNDGGGNYFVTKCEFKQSSNILPPKKEETKEIPEDKPFLLLTFMPYFAGKTLDKAAMEARTSAELLELCLAVSKELERIHGQGILHGDIKSQNIMVHKHPQTKKITVRFIDLEFGYRIGDECATLTDDIKCEGTYWPKERMEGSEVPPAFNQDIYSLGVAFDWLLEGLEDRIAFSTTIKNLFKRCINDKAPSERPTLTQLIQGLQRELRTVHRDEITRTFIYNANNSHTHFRPLPAIAMGSMNVAQPYVMKR